jgi:hypothetical protein
MKSCYRITRAATSGVAKKSNFKLLLSCQLKYTTSNSLLIFDFLTYFSQFVTIGSSKFIALEI